MVNIALYFTGHPRALFEGTFARNTSKTSNEVDDADILAPEGI